MTATGVNELDPLVQSAVNALKLGYPAVGPDVPLATKLRVYEALASEAQDCYRRRHVRECGEDFQRAIAQYRNAVAKASTRRTLEMFEQSLAEMADLVADMLIPAVTA